jgi:hypothetical protein
LAERNASASDNEDDRDTNSDSQRELLQLLRRLPEAQAVALLHQIRDRKGLSDLFMSQKAPRLGITLSQHRTARAVLPPTQTSIEFELMMRHPIAYPTLLPVEAHFISVDDLIKPKLRGRRGNQSAL